MLSLAKHTPWIMTIIHGRACIGHGCNTFGRYSFERRASCTSSTRTTGTRARPRRQVGLAARLTETAREAGAPTPNSSANNSRCSWMALRPATESSDLYIGASSPTLISACLTVETSFWPVVVCTHRCRRTTKKHAASAARRHDPRCIRQRQYSL